MAPSLGSAPARSGHGVQGGFLRLGNGTTTHPVETNGEDQGETDVAQQRVDSAYQLAEAARLRPSPTHTVTALIILKRLVSGLEKRALNAKNIPTAVL